METGSGRCRTRNGDGVLELGRAQCRLVEAGLCLLQVNLGFDEASWVSTPVCNGPSELE